MNKPLGLRRTAIAAVALTTLLAAGCGGTTEEPTEEPTTETTASEVETTEEIQPTGTETTESSEPTEEPEPAETTETSTAEPAPTTGPLEGEELSAEAMAWFDTFCVGIATIGELAGPDTEGMSFEEVSEVVVTTYSDLGSTLTTVGSDLAALPDDFNFEGSAEFSDYVEGNVTSVGEVYATGSQTVADGAFTTEDDLVTAINEIEQEAAAATVVNFGLDSLDPSVNEAVGTQVASCAGLGA